MKEQLPIPGSSLDFQDVRIQFRPLIRSNPSFMPGRNVSVGLLKLSHATFVSLINNIRFPEWMSWAWVVL